MSGAEALKLSAGEGPASAIPNTAHDQTDLCARIETIQTLRARGDLSAAAVLCVGSVARHGERPALLYLLGLTRLEARDPVAAAQALARLTEVSPRSCEAWSALAAARAALGDADAAAAAYRNGLAVDPDNVAARLGLAQVLVLLPDPAAALEAAEAAVGHAPTCPAARAALGFALSAAGRSQEAVAAFQACLLMDSEADNARLALALEHLKASAPQTALDVLEPLPAEARARADVRFVEGAAAAALGRPEEAALAFHRALAADPNRAAAHHGLGNAYAALDRAEDAERALLTALELDPNFAAAHASLSSVYLRAGRRDAAEHHARSALARDPSLAPARLNLAALLQERGDDVGARRARLRVYARQAPREDGCGGDAPRILLLLTSESGGNVPFEGLVDPRRFTRLQWHVDVQPEPATLERPVDAVMNVIADPDRAQAVARRIKAFQARSSRPVLNPIEAVCATARDRVWRTLSAIEGVHAPITVRVAAGAEGGLRAAAEAIEHVGPWIVRPMATHGGRGVALAPSRGALRSHPLDRPAYLTCFTSCRSPDGFYRKYRVLFVDRAPFPYHLAISPQWLVHHYSSGMDADPARIREEMVFLEDPARALGDLAYRAIGAVGQALNLDYAGVDFSVLPDGRLLLFEANAAMLVHYEPEGSPFYAKNPYVRTIFDAFHAHLAAAGASQAARARANAWNASPPRGPEK